VELGWWWWWTTGLLGYGLTHRLGGSCTLRLLLRWAGLKVLMRSSGGVSDVKEEDGSTSSETSVMAD